MPTTKLKSQARFFFFLDKLSSFVWSFFKYAWALCFLLEFIFERLTSFKWTGTAVKLLGICFYKYKSFNLKTRTRDA